MLTNEQLALKFGFKYYPNDEQVTKWVNPNRKWCKCPDFPNDIAACFKWIVPILRTFRDGYRLEEIKFIYEDNRVLCDMSFTQGPDTDRYSPECKVVFDYGTTESEAFCAAVEKIGE